MFIPFVSSRKKLYRRKGGGGGGRGGGGGKGSSGGKGSKGGDDDSVGGGGSKSPASTSVLSMSASSYGGGGGTPSTIPSGQPFAGRTQGGGTRDQIFGSRKYGSGYPGSTVLGVTGRGFPFVFWPLAWGGAAGGAYLYSDEYGAPNNASRPGGIMVFANFLSNDSNTAFSVVADNTSVTSLIGNIHSNCSSHLSPSSSTIPSPFNESDPSTPKPEQVIQYYRASSVALTLKGYNNTATYDPEGTRDTSLPVVDTWLQDCLNQTIALAVPLYGAGTSRWATPNMGLIGLAWVLWCLSSFI